MLEINSIKITSEAQGGNRESSSEGSVEQSYGSMYKNSIEGMQAGMSGPRIAKSFEIRSVCKCCDRVVKVYNLIRRDLYGLRVWAAKCLRSTRALSSDGYEYGHRGVSRRHSSRGDERVKCAMASRTDKGLKHSVYVDLKLNHYVEAVPAE